MPPTVTAVLVNYNGEALIRDCLRSLLDQSHPPEEVLVVDNASTDNSRSIIREQFPRVRLIPLQKNRGYAGGCNAGIFEASHELVALLNNDLILERDWLEKLLSQVDSGFDFWASKILFARDETRIDSAGDGMAVVGSAYKIGHGRPSDGFTESREVFGPCGAAALYRKSLLLELEGLDEDFFLIYEDADLSMRARLLGSRCRFVADARVFHRVNYSIGRFSRTYVYYGHRNSEVLFWKNMPTPLLVRYLPERLLFNLLSGIYFTAVGQGAAFFRAKLDFLRDFGNLRAKRRKVQLSRRLKTRELRAQLDRNWLRHRWKRSVT